MVRGVSHVILSISVNSSYTTAVTGYALVFAISQRNVIEIEKRNGCVRDTRNSLHNPLGCRVFPRSSSTTFRSEGTKPRDTAGSTGINRLYMLVILAMLLYGTDESIDWAKVRKYNHINHGTRMEWQNSHIINIPHGDKIFDFIYMHPFLETLFSMKMCNYISVKF